MLALAAPASPAAAIPVFAHRYGLTCQACHTEIPHLTPFGEAFLANGYRIPGLKPKGAFPVAVRIEASYAGSGAADPDESKAGPLPKTIVDEIEFLIGGSIGDRTSFWFEPYVLDGGLPGSLRDAWVAERLTPDGARTPLLVRAGQFTLPIPLDPETFRETTQPYAIWSQTAGINPFTFFDPKVGIQLEFGNPRALGGSVSLLQGHDRQSGLPSHGTDTMVTLARDVGNLTLQAYRYDGTRELAGWGFSNTQFFSGVADRFWRNGAAVGWRRGGTEVDAAYQIGNDSGADVYGDALVTSGGFLQVRQTLGARVFAIARWDATQDAAFARSVTGGFGYRPTRNTRLTLFETAERDYTGRLLHVISSSLLVAY